MALELKIESLRARGELTVEERDRLLRALRAGGEPPPKRRGWPSRLRLFLLGVVVGLALAYLAWGAWGSFTAG